jgi:hypothetical protein
MLHQDGRGGGLSHAPGGRGGEQTRHRIKASKSWQKGHIIILVWDENDYSNAANRVVMLVETSYAANDGTSLIMNDMFGGK